MTGSTAERGFRPAAAGALFALPAVLWTVVFFLSPLVLMAVYSVWTFRDGRIVAEWTLQNYAAIAAAPVLISALVNSIEVAAAATVLSIAIAYPAAHILAYRVPQRWRLPLLALAVLPFFTSYLVRSYSWLLVLSDRGVVNGALLATGLVSEPLRLSHGRGAVLLGMTHFFTMLLMLSIYARLARIDPAYRRAAADLGASGWRIFRHITLPLSLPGVAVGGFLTFVMAIGDYVTPQLLGGGRELLLPQAIMLNVTRYVNLPMAAAISMVLFAVVAILFVLFRRRLRADAA